MPAGRCLLTVEDGILDLSGCRADAAYGLHVFTAGGNTGRFDGPVASTVYVVVLLAISTLAAWMLGETEGKGLTT
jgi:hypothetical protein